METNSVNVGDKVSQGTSVGKCGQTGNATGPHLDYKVFSPNGDAINPYTRFSK